MRRTDRQSSEAEAREILARAEYGVLATAGGDGWPYAVPVNHVLSGDALYIHSAQEGHKLDNIAAEERISFCTVASFQVLPETLSTLYESAVVFGRASVVSDASEKRRALELMMQRFNVPAPQAEKALRLWFAKTTVIRVDIERITGKAHRA
jgi:nitroimidazol reductase NimA-like FMN-containing flavoprotein (pyridoxamine 5'-phosphate oxidase superfamily)